MLDVRALDIDLIRAEKSRRSLQEFIRLFWPVVEPSQQYVHNWHIDALCEHLANIDQIHNLLISVPPGCMKSLLCDVFYPCWRWVHDPSLRFLFASYSLGLAERDSLKCRRLIASPLYQKCFGHLFQIIDRQDTKRHFENDKTGYRQSISTGSQTKGLKGNLILIDDPLNSSDANSDILKQELRDWWTDSFFDRLCDFEKDARVVVGQRVAKDDLHAFILENYGSDWTHLCLPWEYKPTPFISPIGWKDPRKQEGEPLWPARFPDSAINQLKKKTRTWATQWQQNPVDGIDSIFKAHDLRHYTETPTEYVCGDKRIGKNECWKLMAGDLAYSLSDRADFTVFVVAHLARTGEIIILDVFRDRIPSTRIVPKLVEFFDMHRPAYVIIEDVAFQRVLIDQAKLEGVAVRGVRPEADKETRSLPMQVRMEQHQLWLPQHAPWLSAVEQEILEFPNGSYDDCVDAISQVAIEAGKRNRSRPEPTPEPTKPKAFAPWGKATSNPWQDANRMKQGMTAGLR